MDPIQETETASTNTPGDEKSTDEVALWKTAIDPYGRRSMALQRSNGEITTATEMWERSCPGPENAALREYQHQLDELMCWFMFEDWKSARMRNALQLVCLPVFFLRIGGFLLRLQVDSWRRRWTSRTLDAA